MKEDVKQLIKHIWENHRGKAVGTLLGIVLGAAILFIGFWKTVFILLCGVIGLYIGIKVDRNENVFESLERWFPPFFRR